MVTLAERARVRIGPLCWVVPVSELESWVRDAGDGERFTYARGLALAQASAVVVLAREYAQLGWVRTHNLAVTGADGQRETEWFCVRKRPVPVDQAERAPAMAEPPADAEELDAILRALSRAANMKMVAPTNGELAGLCGIRDARRVRYLVGKLISDGAVRITDHGPRARRIVTIVSTGKSTVAGRL